MSIASEISRIKGNVSASYTVCRELGAIMPADQNSDHLADTINTITGGSPAPSVEKDVNFYDYDGTLLHSYTLAEAQALSALPALPTHTGLVAQEWNNTLQEIKTAAAAGRGAEVGCSFDTSDGSTKLYLKAEAHATLPEIHLDLSLSPSSTVTIDWGDNTTPQLLTNSSSGEVSAQTISHTYQEFAQATTVCITITGGTFRFGWGSASWSSGGRIKPLIRANIGSNCVAINMYAFKKCKKLTTITLPNTIEAIQSYAFNECFALQHITIPKSIEFQLGDYVFSHCYSLASIATHHITRGYGRACFANCCNLKTIILSERIESISKDLFNGCSNLFAIHIPDGVTTIDDYAFNACVNLSDVNLPVHATSIGIYAFSNCLNLKTINITSSVTTIKDYAFYQCKSLTEIAIPNSVTLLGNGVFNGCIALKTANIPNTTAQVGTGLFASCVSLSSITIPDSATSIGADAFYENNLTTVAIPDSVTSIGVQAFYHCDNLQVIDLTAYADPNDIPALEASSTFANTTCKFLVANATMLAAFQAATNWSSISSDRWEALS